MKLPTCAILALLAACSGKTVVQDRPVRVAVPVPAPCATKRPAKVPTLRDRFSDDEWAAMDARQKAAAVAEHAIRLREHPEEALDVPGVVRGVAAILEERNRAVHLDRHGPEPHGDPERRERIHVLAVEVRDGLRAQGDGAGRPIARPDDVIFAADLPKTRSGKIMRRLLRDIAEGKALGDTTTLADPAVVARLKEQYADEH